MNELLTGVLTSAIVGGLSWGAGKVLSLIRQSNGVTTAVTVQPYQAYPGYPPIPQQPTNAVNPSQVLLQVGILQFIVNIVAYVIGVLVRTLGSGSDATTTDLQAITNLLVLVFGTVTAVLIFMIFGLRVDRAIRWKHLTYVAIGTAFATLLVNAIVGIALTGSTVILSSAAAFTVSLFFALTQSFIAMGIGGGLAALFAPKRAPVPVAVPGGYMPVPGAPYPYGYGAPPSTPMYPPPGYPAAPSTPMYPGYPAYPGNPAAPSTPIYPPPAQPGAPSTPMYPQYGPQYPPPPGTYPPGWGAPPPANPGGQPPSTTPPGAQPAPPPPSAEPGQGNPRTS
jgi:hypothetical protein